MKLSPHFSCNRYIGNRIGTTDLMVKQAKSDPGSIRKSRAQAGLTTNAACGFILKS